MPLPALYPGEAAATSSAPVQMMQAAQAERARKEEERQQKLATEKAMAAHSQAIADQQQQESQHRTAEDARQSKLRTMTGDIAVTAPTYGNVKWDEVDPSTRTDFSNRYGIDAMADAQKAWDSSVPPQNRVLRGQAAKLGIQVQPNASDEEVQTAIAQHQEAAQTATAAAAAQKENSATSGRNSLVIDRTKRMVQNMPQVRFYNAALANYDSIQRNSTKPNRTGADDAFLLQAAATMEAPGRSPTGNDVKEFMRANGIRGNLDVIAQRFEALFNQSPEAQAKAGRLMTDDLARQIAAASKNSLDTRRASLVDAITPHVNRLEDIGEDPYRHIQPSLVDAVYGPREGQPQNLPPAATPAQRDTVGSLQKELQNYHTNPQAYTPEVRQNFEGRWKALGGTVSQDANGLVSFQEPVAAPIAQGSIPTITTPEEHARIPKGQQFIWNGKTLTKQ